MGKKTIPFILIFFLLHLIRSNFLYANELINFDLLNENNFFLKAGTSFSYGKMQSQFIDFNLKNEDESSTQSFGVNTSAGHTFSHFDISIQSDLLFGKLKNLSFEQENEIILGNGKFRIFTLSPLLSIKTPYLFFNKWNLNFKLGPIWSLHTFIIENTEINSKKEISNRLNFQCIGGNLILGLEEFTALKDEHPLYFELGYNYMQSEQVFFADASDQKEVLTILKKDSKALKAHQFSFRVGVTLF